MKILGILLTILFSSLTITHAGKKKLELSKQTCPQNDAAIPVYYESSPSYAVPDEAPVDCAEPVGYKAVEVVPPSYQKNAGPVGCEAAPAGVSISYSKNVGASGLSLPYKKIIDPIGKGLSVSYEKNLKPHGYHTAGAALAAPCEENVHPVEDVVPVRSSYSHSGHIAPTVYYGNECDTVPSGVSVSYQKNVGPVNYGTVPIGPSVTYQDNVSPIGYEAVPIGPSTSYQKNAGPINYGVVSIGPSATYQDNVGRIGYEAVPVSPSVSYRNNAGPIGYEAIPVDASISYQKNVGPIGYEAVPISPFISYQKNIGPIGHEAVPIGPSISYQKNVGPIGYEAVPIGPSISYQKIVGSIGYEAVPVSPSISYQKNVGPDGCEEVPISPSISYPKNVDSVATYTPTYVSSMYAEVANPVVAIPSAQQSTSKQLSLLAKKKHKSGLGGYHGSVPYAISAYPSSYAPSSEGPYVIISSAQPPTTYGPMAGSVAYDC